MIQVKICGIKDPVAFDAAIEADTDWVGFNFFPPSPRFVTPAAAAALSGRTIGGPRRVGLFVKPTMAEISAVIDLMPLDALQIYGPPHMLPDISARFGLSIWYPVGVSKPSDLPHDAHGASGLLLEAKPPPGADRPGGNATTFDWSILRDWLPPVPWLLAGGLRPDNVADAIRQSGAKAVDVSSGVESRKGVKDAQLIRSFIRAAKDIQT